MILDLIRNSEWRYLLDFVSPVFFEIVPLRRMMAEAYQLNKNRNTQAKLNLPDLIDTKQKISLNHIHQASPTMLSAFSENSLSQTQLKAFGELVLQWYFHQILHQKNILIDFDRKHFYKNSDTTEIYFYQDKSLWIAWDADFREAIRRVYQGFYYGHDKEFIAGLKSLNLDQAADLFREHFGADDQSKVNFQLKTFIKNFHQIFVFCKDNKIKLHPNFLSFGLYLTGLYRLLDNKKIGYNVRSAYQKASQT